MLLSYCCAVGESYSSCVQLQLPVLICWWELLRPHRGCPWSWVWVGAGGNLAMHDYRWSCTCVVKLQLGHSHWTTSLWRGGRTISFYDVVLERSRFSIMNIKRVGIGVLGIDWWSVLLVLSCIVDEDWDYTIITSVSDGSWLDASFRLVGRKWLYCTLVSRLRLDKQTNSG